MASILKPGMCETLNYMNICGPYGPFLKTFTYNMGHLIFSLFLFKVNLESKWEILLQSPDSGGIGFSEKLLKQKDL